MEIALGQHSERGRKDVNQDFHGACLPRGARRAAKGIALAIADGIGSSTVSQVASQFAVTGFLEDYYCTSDAWSVKTAVERVVSATNSWLHAQTRDSPWRYERDRGYACTFSAAVLKGRTAHLFHVGDSRIWHLRDGEVEQLTEDHRLHLGGGQSHLGRALGAQPRVEIDYRQVALEEGDWLLLTTDGIHEHVGPERLRSLVAGHAADPDAAARAIAAAAHEAGSDDNLTVQVVRIDALPAAGAADRLRQLEGLSLPPLLEPRADFEGYRIVRPLHESHRSHVYLATAEDGRLPVVIKIPSVAMQAEPRQLERFLLEEWIARRIDSPHVLRAVGDERGRRYVFVAMEYVEGRTLAQWMRDHPRPPLDAVRGLLAQAAAGLRAFHRLEMVHQDLRPENLMIDATGTVKIIDFGAVQVAGIAESASPEEGAVPGAIQYAAPEFFLGEGGSVQADVFSLGVIAYQMLCGRLPYGAAVPAATTRAAQRRLRYRSLLEFRRDIPAWVDGAIRKAVHPDPCRRHADAAEFIHDLTHPDPALDGARRVPLAERDPLLFWKGVSLALLAALVVVAGFRTTLG